MTNRITGISSMATRAVLAELTTEFTRHTGVAVDIESVGGVDAAKRVTAGERFDVILLASDAIDRLLSAGCGLAGSRVDLVHSGVAVAMQAGATAPDIGTEAALRNAVLAAPSIGHSTGPSGVQLLKLFERWGILAELQGRIHQAPPGVPVGTMVAQGQVALGFQQLSELIHLPGITVIGPLPDAVQINTTFSACIGAACSQPDAVHALLAFLTSPQAQDAKRRHGMAPA